VNPFVRMVGFFALAWVLTSVLQALPGIGFLFRGFFAFWLVLIALSLGLERLARAARRRRRLDSELRALGNVESAHNQGKLGSLLLAHGRPARAVEPLRRAGEGEPETAEWHYRLGQALLRLGRTEEALAPLERAAAIDAEHAYGGVQLSLSEACLELGRWDAALEHLATFERNHGPSPESACRRGLALKGAGRRDEARRAFSEVSALARASARYQRKDHRRWVVRAHLAKL